MSDPARAGDPVMEHWMRREKACLTNVNHIIDMLFFPDTCLDNEHCISCDMDVTDGMDGQHSEIFGGDSSQATE